MQSRPSRTLEQILERYRDQERRTGQHRMSIDHIFLAILRENRSHATYILSKLLRDWEIQQIYTRIERELARADREPERLDDDEQFYDLLRTRLALQAENAAGHGKIFNTAHLLLAVVRDRRLISSRVLASYHVTERSVLEYIGQLPEEEDIQVFDEAAERSDQEEDFYSSSSNRYMQPISFPHQNDVSVILDKYGVNLTREAVAGRFDPVIGRTHEIDRLIQILGRRKKNNPVLIGEAGVGKSAIVEGLALRIAQNEVPYTLRGKTLFSLDIASLIAGTKYRGQFEERIKTLLTALNDHPEIILFVDEIHTIVGAGSTQGTLDTANILKPALARGELRCIGATTLAEYREFIESDSALERRFQKILVEPTRGEETLQILRNVKTRYEEHHCVRYTDAAIEACVALADRYMTDRSFPDKAFDILDEAGAKSHVFNLREPDEIVSLEVEAEMTAGHKRQAIAEQAYERAAGLRNQELAMRMRAKELREAWMKTVCLHPIEIDVPQIEQVVAAATGIPVERISQGEKNKLQGIRQYLDRMVLGQEEAVNKVVRAIRRSRTGLNDPEKPIGVFLFVGPTGVGKTYLAKELARWLFDREDALIRVDMSEYAEKHNVSRLIGSPPGYVGYAEGGQLTEKVRRHPYSVVLFDEIEKAHPDVFHVMLQLFDEGQLTDGLGRKVDFRNTILIMTSNVGSKQVAQFGRAVGYGTANKDPYDLANKESIYRRSLEQHFAPEFLNRIDDIVIFNTLGEEDVRRIIELEFERLNRRVVKLGYRLSISEEAKAALVRSGYEAKYGVRSLKRALLDQVEEPLAELIVEGHIAEGQQVEVGCLDEKIRLQVAE